MSQNNGLDRFISYVQRCYRPAIVAWVLQRGISYLVSGVRDPLADNVIAAMNAFIHQNMPNTTEFGRLQFPWWGPFYDLTAGVLLILLGLGLGVSMLPGSGSQPAPGEAEP
jgi:hypothetical protein